jgi:hypothetical protein
MIQIIYRSTQVRPLSIKDFHGILEKSRIKNARLGITGVLFYDGSDFIQVLEGGEGEVQYLYGALVSDPRHRDVIPTCADRDSRRGFPRRAECESLRQTAGGLPWQRRSPFASIMMVPAFGLLLVGRGMPTRRVGFWPWRQSMTVAAGDRRPSWAGLACKLSGIGLFGSTRTAQLA